MRHQKKKGRMSRRSSWRKATLRSLATDLFTHQRIETTFTKAKALRVYAEPLITLAKNAPDDIAARRLVFKKIPDKKVIKNLFVNLGPLFKEVNGGYTRIMPLGNRKGDGAEMAIIELTKRTISDEDLLGKIEIKEKKAKKGGAAKGKQKKQAKADPEQKGHAAPEIDIEEKEKAAVEDVKKEKAKNEQKKIGKQGLFKRFRRKSIG